MGGKPDGGMNMPRTRTEYVMHLCEYELEPCEDDGCCDYEVEATNKRTADAVIAAGGVYKGVWNVHAIYKTKWVDDEVDDEEIYWEE